MVGTALGPDPLGEMVKVRGDTVWGGHKWPKREMVLTQHMHQHLPLSGVHPPVEQSFM